MAKATATALLEELATDSPFTGDMMLLMVPAGIYKALSDEAARRGMRPQRLLAIAVKDVLKQSPPLVQQEESLTPLQG